MKQNSSGFAGVYYREGSGKKRIKPDGSFDKCFSIRYMIDGKNTFETIGWESDGVTLQQAVEIRAERLRTAEVARAPSGRRKSRTEYIMKRIKTPHVGVYYRYAKNRVDSSGNNDKCYDILYSLKGKMVYERVGWASEGYTVEDAVKLRGLRMKALRHPELCPDEAEKLLGPTLNEVWELYKKRWVPTLKSTSVLGMYKRYIEPVFGSCVVSGIQQGAVEDFKVYLLNSAKTRTGQPLSAASVLYILSTLRRVINKAREWGVVKVNEKLVSQAHIPGSDVKRERFLTRDEANKLFDCLQHVSCTLYFIAKISLYTGMRLSEILNLRGQSIDLRAGIIITDGKTGRRTAYIADELKKDLKQLIPNKPSELVFVSKKGKVLRKGYVSAAFHEIFDALGFNLGVTDNAQKVVFHTLRHTFCSWLAIKGVPLYTIGKLVGHAKIEMTQRYAKLSPDHQKTALKYIAETLSE